jgi:hypothetical protein
MRVLNSLSRVRLTEAWLRAGKLAEAISGVLGKTEAEVRELG